MSKCPLCKKPIKPKQKLMSWFEQDANRNVVKRGAVHLKCVDKGVSNAG